MITELTDRCIAIKIPSMAFGFDVNNYGNSSEFMYMLDLAQITDDKEYRNDEALITKKLPTGNWSILGRPNEITVKDWNRVIDNPGISVIAAGIYLIKSKNVNPESVIILIKQ